MQVDIVLAAGEDHPLDIAGNYFFVDSGEGNISVSADGGDPLIRAPGQGAQRADGKPWKNLRIRNLYGAQNTIRIDILMVTDWQLVDHRTNVTVNTHGVTQSGAWTVGVDALSLKDRMGGASEAVTSAAAVAIFAAGTAGKQRSISIRPVGGDIYIADDNGVGAANGILVPDGATYSDDNYIGAVYAIAVSANATVYYGSTDRA